MDKIAVGLDFGTANSAAAVCTSLSENAQVLDLDPEATDTRLLRSVLFFPETNLDVLTGAAAIERYLEWADGRFVQSIKSFLPSKSFARTEIRRKSVLIEELVALLLRRMRVEIERATHARVSSFVLGRPAVFSTEPELDQLAQDRLARAAEIAGFPAPTFVIEPVAAALRFEEQLTHDELVLVCDLGAGTSDFTVMRLGPTRRGQLDRRADILGSAGAYVGGDTFDAAIVEHALLRHFGRDATWKGETKRLPMPSWLVRKVLAWNELAFLRTRESLALIRRMEETSDQPKALKNLRLLVEDNLGFQLFQSVEQAKRTLSEADTSPLVFDTGGLTLTEHVTRRQFEKWTAPILETIWDAAKRAIDASGGTLPDSVFLTGGTSRIPSVRRLFSEKIGAERLREGDALTSVAAGLGRAAFAAAHST